MAPSTSRPVDPGPAPAPGAAPRPARAGEPLVPPRSPLAAFDAYHAAVQAERYRVTAIAMRPDGTKMAFILDKKDGVTLGFTPDELRGRARELERLERRGENLYYTPLSSSKHHLLVDDMNREKLERLIRDGFRPAALLESSPGNYQAIITIRKLGSDHDRDVGNRLSLQLNREYGDPNLSGAIHPHRAPGFSNHKPKHRRADGSYPEVLLLRAEPRECEHTLALSRAVLAEREAAERRQREQAALRPQIAPAAAETTVAAYYAHHGDVSARIRGDLDASRVDAMIAVRLRATGHAPGAIADAVERCAPTVRPVEKQSSHDWALYAQRTVQFAYGPAGEQQLDQTRRYHEQWRRLERDAHRPTVAPPATPAAPGRDADNTPDL